MLHAAMTIPDVAELPAPASPASLRARRRHLLGLLGLMVLLALVRSPTTCVLLNGFTFQLKESSAGPATTSRRLIYRPTWSRRQRPGHGVPRANTQKLHLCDGGSAETLRTSQFEGEPLRLGRATLPS